ncbi:hypothetical protein KIN20_007310 [Parelaphostrongylus tenuis]|uniref:Uncharacterized protein n=1 Tax=Parelaphostrongylus tenuis TaxID=148309 RepID=A0AAD5QJ28_PARTN|nr:hypothetical protein KIN20_007310 [Parelaphostrongylus tenuis]
MEKRIVSLRSPSQGGEESCTGGDVGSSMTTKIDLPTITSRRSGNLLVEYVQSNLSD